MSQKLMVDHPLLHRQSLWYILISISFALPLTKELFPTAIFAFSFILLWVFVAFFVNITKRFVAERFRFIFSIGVLSLLVFALSELIRLYFFEQSITLSFYVTLMISNVVMLVQTMKFSPELSLGKALLKSLLFSSLAALILVIVAFARELLGKGELWGTSIFPLVANNGWYLPNQVMLSTAGAFFFIGVLYWGVVAIRRSK